MKKQFLFTFLFFSASLFAEVAWESSFESALERAESEKKLVMVMLSKEHCDACWYMENIVFEKSKIEKMIDKRFISFRVDIHNDKIPKNMPFIGTPTFYFLDADGKKIDKLEGAANVKEFTAFVKKLKL